MKKIIPLIVFLILGFRNYSQSNIIESKIDKTDLKEYISILSSDSLNGRFTGTIGQKKASKFIADRFNKIGLIDKFNNGYFEKFNLNKTRWGQVYLKTDNKIFHNFVNLIYQGDSNNEETEIEIIFGGQGTSEHLSKINVENRYVLIFTNNLRAPIKNYKELKKLIDRKALGLIVVNPNSNIQFESMVRTLKDFYLKERMTIPRKEIVPNHSSNFLNRFTITSNQIKEIIGKSSNQLNKLIKLNQIENCPISRVKIKRERIIETIETENIVGFINGISDKSILISAHYDHLGGNGKNYYPGADDNASGISALLELAENYMNKKNLKYNIIFLATSGEEVGLLGSYYHANNPTFIPENIIVNLNLDMISRVDKKHSKKQNYLYSIGTDINPKLSELFKKADKLSPNCYFDYSYDNSKDLTGVYHLSDQYSFYKKKIPSIMLFSGLHKDYHKYSDKVDKIDFNLLENRVKLISKVVEQIQKSN
mgnify:CR=1 FL=1|tara:strand:+ start:74 stop:1516 length:1443 start_codon:yes stop_codon:yes gene_type:complete